MDFFGIGAGIKGAAKVYCQSARATGRTISMINSLKSGDRVVFHNGTEARRVNNLCKQRGIEINYIVASVNKIEDLFRKETSQGRTIFDHSWIEKYYLDGIDRLNTDIKNFQIELSGWGEVHEETKLKAQELSKWNF